MKNFVAIGLLKQKLSLLCQFNALLKAQCSSTLLTLGPGSSVSSVDAHCVSSNAL